MAPGCLIKHKKFVYDVLSEECRLYSQTG